MKKETKPTRMMACRAKNQITGAQSCDGSEALVNPVKEVQGDMGLPTRLASFTCTKCNGTWTVNF